MAITTPKSNSFLSHFFTVVIGFILIALFAVISFYVTAMIAYLYADSACNSFTLADKGLYVYSVSFVNTIIFSYVYFSIRRISRRILLPIHSMIFVLFLGLFISQLFLIRKDQQDVLESYHALREAFVSGEYELAFDLMSPDYRQTRTSDEFRSDMSWLQDTNALESVDSIYTVEVKSREEAFFIADPKASYWYRTCYGISLDFEKIDGKWYFTGRTGFYMVG